MISGKERSLGQLRTWLKVGARRKGEGAHEVIPWEERQQLRDELEEQTRPGEISRSWL